EWVKLLPLQLERSQTIESTLDSVGPKKKVCITGTLDMTRKDLTEHLEQFGYIVNNSVTKDTYCLISDGEQDSSKYTKAMQYGIKIIDYWSNRKNILNGVL
ncbi:MAG: BRCT domain-containing protein, partial [Thermodesulfobacteriota bacterium]